MTKKLRTPTRLELLEDALAAPRVPPSLPARLTLKYLQSHLIVRPSDGAVLIPDIPCARRPEPTLDSDRTKIRSLPIVAVPMLNLGVIRVPMGPTIRARASNALDDLTEWYTEPNPLYKATKHDWHIASLHLDFGWGFSRIAQYYGLMRDGEDRVLQSIYRVLQSMPADDLKLARPLLTHYERRKQAEIDSWK